MKFAHYKCYYYYYYSYYRIVPKEHALCNMHGSGNLRQLSVAMPLSICEHIDIDVGNIKGQRKAPYLS